MMDPLEQFATWWLTNRPFKPPFEDTLAAIPNAIIDPEDTGDGASGVVLFRDGAFQVQMFTVPPFGEIVDHTHPNVDSFEVYLAGDIEFRVDGEVRTRDETRQDNDTTSSFGKMMRITPMTPHGGTFGPRGGVFLSIQQWLNGVKPSSVHLDWAYSKGE